ncbi:MAG: lysine--tRNA ligase [Phycisphaerales bacterium]|nr:lysine--tRNA ligase [Phycisphaerales bacterium]
MSADTTSSTPIHPLEQQRRDNRDAVAALGMAPYGQRFDGLVSLADARAMHSEEADAAHAAAGKTPPADYTDKRPRVTVAGRIMLLRDNGKLIWLTLRDDTGDLQVAVSQRDVDEAGFACAKKLDLGDLIVVSGPLMKTKTGEITVWPAGAGSVRPASKCLVPPPEKHAGLHDVEIRYRHRYVDLWSTPETMQVFRLRSKIVSTLRRHLESCGFLEVETPMLQIMAGGAAARPFTTHMNAMDLPLYLRIAPELYLKRLMVGGMRKVFEINRNFRNEGMDKNHNPEFTMIELYDAYGDCGTVMEITESMIREAARVVKAEGGGRGAAAETADLRLPFGDLVIDYGRPFDRVTFAELFARGCGFEMGDVARARREAVARHILKPDEAAKLDDVFIINELFEELGEKTIDPARPTFICEYPAAISPLTRPKPGNPAVAERADLFIAHMEIGPHYTELNDPDVQAAKFREQLRGLDDEESTFRNFDADFIHALKVGMPPAGGMGVGIDRLTMILTNQRTIRDVVLFPLMRPDTQPSA